MARKQRFDDEWGEARKPKAQKKKGRNRADDPNKLMELAQNGEWDEFLEDEFYE